MKKQKRYWEMNTSELAAATKEFDDPNYDPPAIKPTKKQLAQVQRWKRKRAEEKSKLIIMLDATLIEQADNYALTHGMTVSDLVEDGLRKVMRKKSA